MNVLPRDKQIEVLAALCDGLGVRAASRITGVNRGTVADLALKVGRGCAVLHDGKMRGVRTSRLELDELWAYVGRKQARIESRLADLAWYVRYYATYTLNESGRDSPKVVKKMGDPFRSPGV